MKISLLTQKKGQKMFLTEKIKVTDVKKDDLLKCRNINEQFDRYRKVLATMNPIVDDQLEIIAGDY